MTSFQHLAQPLPLPVIHARWTAALSLPPTAQISNLRRLVRAVTQNRHPALRGLKVADLCQLYLDLALAYAFLGEYYLAANVFKAAVDNDPTCAVGWFGLGLAQAELAEWRNARRSWKKCLWCFGPWESIPYSLFRAQDERIPDFGLDSGEWRLERTRVQFNLNVALCEKGSKKFGISPRAPGQKRPGLNGIPAGLRFGPGWDATLQSLHTPRLIQHSSFYADEPGDRAGFNNDPQPAVQTPPSFSTSPPDTPTRISSRRPLPRISCSSSTPILSLVDEVSFNNHTPSLNEDPLTSSPADDIVDLFADTSQALIAPSYQEYHERFSRQSTLFTPQDQYFSDHFDYDEDIDESLDTCTAIDETIASWSTFDQTQLESNDGGATPEEQDDDDDEKQQDENVANGSPEAEAKTSQNASDSNIDDGEILQPRVFEGFGPLSQQERYVKSKSSPPIQSNQIEYIQTLASPRLPSPPSLKTRTAKANHSTSKRIGEDAMIPSYYSNMTTSLETEARSADGRQSFATTILIISLAT